MNSIISGIGVYVPDKVLTNTELENKVDTSSEWIIQRTGIHERRIVTDETTTDMAVKAVENMCRMYNKCLEDIDFVIVSSSTTEHRIPSVASQLCDRLKIKNAGSYDLTSACAGFTYALIIAQSLIYTGNFKKILIISAEVLSRHTDYTDRTTCILFGDAASAIIVESTNEKIFYTPITGTEGHNGHLLYLSQYPVKLNGMNICGDNTIFQDGKKVFKWAVERMSQIVLELLEKNKLTLQDIDHFIPHSANIRIIEAICSRINYPFQKTLTSVKNFGNTSAVSIPLALHAGVIKNKLKKEDRILMLGFGGGLTYSGVITDWIL